MNTHLTLAQRALLTAELEQRQQDLERQIAGEFGGASRVEHAREVLLQDGDDAPARDADREVDLARSDQDLDELRAVKDALVRMQGSTYGLCADCGAEVPYARLQHTPEVLRCIACQTALEARLGIVHRASI
jgi:DnaK suppressor protein